MSLEINLNILIDYFLEGMLGLFGSNFAVRIFFNLNGKKSCAFCLQKSANKVTPFWEKDKILQVRNNNII